MSNHITIELCKEDRQRLDELIAFAALLVGEKHSKPEETQIPGQMTLFTKNTHPVDAVSPHADPEPVAEPEAPKATRDDVQALVIKLAAPGAGKKDAARAIVYEYAKKVSDIPEDKLDEVMAKLSKLAEEE